MTVRASSGSYVTKVIICPSPPLTSCSNLPHIFVWMYFGMQVIDSGYPGTSPTAPPHLLFHPSNQQRDGDIRLDCPSPLICQTWCWASPFRPIPSRHRTNYWLSRCRSRSRASEKHNHAARAQKSVRPEASRTSHSAQS